jgi:hypothetical protein
MRAHLTALRAHYEPIARRAFTDARSTFGVVRAATVRASVVVGRGLKRAALVTLEGLETVLLSPSGRERIHATATFSLIFLFAVTSVDFLISGGPEFGAPARAAQPQRLVRVSPAPTTAAEVNRAPDASVPTALSPSLEDARAANVVAVSQTFTAPAAAANPSVAGEARAAARPQAGVDLADGPSIDTANEAGATGEASPRKHIRVKDAAA